MAHTPGHEEWQRALSPDSRECTHKAKQRDSNNETATGRCSPLIRGTHYCICQFNRNHFKLLVPDKRIKFYLVISIETKEFAEIFSIWFLNHILLNVSFKNQHWFSKTGSWNQEEPDGKKGVTVNRYSLLISWYLKNECAYYQPVSKQKCANMYVYINCFQIPTCGKHA